jgi:8-oxo-dGTP diphosphatase
LKNATPSIHVVAGALFNSEGRVLIAQRPSGKHMAGGWEFPGGKLAESEAPYAGLVRELREEIGVEVLEAEPLIAYAYEYPDKCVWLDLWRVLRYAHAPRSLDGQALRWLALEELPTAPLLEADRPMVEALLELHARNKVPDDD